MRILSINKFYRMIGGSERVYFATNALLEKNGHHIIPFSMRHASNMPNEFNDYFVSPVSYDGRRVRDRLKAAARIFYSAEANRKLKKLIKHYHPDIAHLHLVYHQIPISILEVMKNRGIPTVHTLHDYKPICPNYTMVSHHRICEDCKSNKFYMATKNRCHDNSLLLSFLNTVEMYAHHMLGYYSIPDIFISPSRFMVRKMIDFGMPEKKFVHIPNFIDSKQYQISGNYDNAIVFLGRLVPEKGIGTLLSAFKGLNNENIQLLIFGDGPMRVEIQQWLSKFNVHNVHMFGFVDIEQIKKYLANCLFTVVPSEWYENCPMSVLESMAMQKTVLAADIGGLPELIDNRVDGMLFESGNVDDLTEKLQYMVANRETVISMGKTGRNKIEREYNKEIYYQRLITAYETARSMLR